MLDGLPPSRAINRQANTFRRLRVVCLGNRDATMLCVSWKVLEIPGKACLSSNGFVNGSKSGSASLAERTQTVGRPGIDNIRDSSD